MPQVSPLRAEPLAEEQVGQDVPVGVDTGETVVGAALVVIVGETVVGAAMEGAVVVVICAELDVASERELDVGADAGAARPTGGEHPGPVRLMSSM